jgi:hypothetical protein
MITVKKIKDIIEGGIYSDGEVSILSEANIEKDITIFRGKKRP